jgi:cyclohexadieny/prephenate dehydrogenase
MNDPRFDKITLIGIGLIGSSIARAIRAKNLARDVVISTDRKSVV